ncbi:hypothetical protein G647_04004 [Cladophialophora carrionii CBS 160.54]|uniref:Mitochondrial phosphate carrier protein n=2 Tax=Cladophialophora carrionii TaxID=86049 RepID=A0A1C1CVZ1_9EURO|nr:uncharacterized protein G647_04004 [Cladophialophora carrionii CBS 160.54]ETI24635.1 hypothetical protein G647_04004 [Cladophialophora carrionii CBS 160.54]OCT52616.1 hypothetical protein CLCR_11094 [Cladophialophora carrionii]
MIFTRGVSLTNFVIASSALGFQVFVLYPWHKRLDEDFERLKEEHISILHQDKETRLSELRGINEQLKRLGKIDGQSENIRGRI